MGVQPPPACRKKCGFDDTFFMASDQYLGVYKGMRGLEVFPRALSRRDTSPEARWHATLEQPIPVCPWTHGFLMIKGHQGY